MEELAWRLGRGKTTKGWAHMNEAEMRLAYIAYGLPSWPRIANKFNHGVAAALAVFLAVTQNFTAGAKYAGSMS